MSETKIYKGRVREITHLYNPRQYFEKIGIQFGFQTGTIKYLTENLLFIGKGDIIHFKARKVDHQWFITEIIKVDKPPMKKITFKDRQYQRLIKNI